MLNIDKYREELMNIMKEEIDFDCNIAALRGTKGCETYCEACLKASLNWLLKEYEPPLLENGDDLEPGDWIMVRYDDDDEPWTKTQFLAYIDGMFYTREPLNGRAFKLAVYYQARLPMEGE